MQKHKSDFLKALSKEKPSQVPLYCTGYPEIDFIENYLNQYTLKTEKIHYNLNDKNYYIIEQMGFNAVSLWDFRRGKGGYNLDNNRRVAAWGRIYKGDWYSWKGVFRDEKTITSWEHLHLPSKETLNNLKEFIKKPDSKLEYVLSLPGLFEKTWQSMGFSYFSKCLKKRDFNHLETAISFFSNYILKLIKRLQATGAKTFIIADDLGYKNRTFIRKEIWDRLFSKNYKEIINRIHDRKQHIIIHSDGYISDMIELLIDLGFDAVQSLEPNAGVDIFKLFKVFSDQICFIGNLDISLLSFGTPDQIKNYVTKLIEKAKKHHCSLVVSPTQQINGKCNPKNINAMIQTAKIFK